MFFRLLFILCFAQTVVAQDSLAIFMDSLVNANDQVQKSKIGQEIALRLQNEDWQRTLYYLEFAENAAKESESKKALADFYITSADIYYKKDAFDIALQHYLKAYDYYKKHNSPQSHLLENALAIVYARTGHADKALPFFKRVYEYQLKKGDSLYLAKILNNIGNLYMGSNKDSSLVYFNRSLDYAKKLKHNDLLVHLYTNLGRYYLKSGNFQKAKENLNKAMATLEKGVEPRVAGWSQNVYARFYLKSNKPDSSIVYARKALKNIEAVAPNSIENLKAVELLYKAFVKNENYKKAVSFFEKFNTIRDTLNIIDRKANVERFLLAEEYKSKEKIRVLEEEKETFKYYIIGLSLIVGVLTLFLLLIRYRNILKRAKLENELIQAKQKESDANLQLKNKELAGKAMIEMHRAELMEEILNDFKELKKKAVKKEMREAIDYIVKRLKSGTNSNIWDEFEIYFEQVHESFYKTLHKKHPDLSLMDKRLCALLKLNLTTKEIAQVTGQSLKSVENARTRLRKKLQITHEKTDLSAYLFNFG